MDAQEEMRLKKEFLQHFRYYRHDFLNHIQLIKAYLTLGKIDEARKYLDQAVGQMDEDSKLSRLGDPRLTYFLLTYNLKQHKVQLEVDINMDQERIPYIGSKHSMLLYTLQKIMELLEAGSQAGSENHLFVVFQETEGRLHTLLDFAGKWDVHHSSDRLQQLQATIESEQGKLVKSVHNGHLQLNIEIYS